MALNDIWTGAMLSVLVAVACVVCVTAFLFLSPLCHDAYNQWLYLYYKVWNASDEELRPFLRSVPRACAALLEAAGAQRH